MCGPPAECGVKCRSIRRVRAVVRSFSGRRLEGFCWDRGPGLCSSGPEWLCLLLMKARRSMGPLWERWRRGAFWLQRRRCKSARRPFCDIINKRFQVESFRWKVKRGQSTSRRDRRRSSGMQRHQRRQKETRVSIDDAGNFSWVSCIFGIFHCSWHLLSSPFAVFDDNLTRISEFRTSLFFFSFTDINETHITSEIITPAATWLWDRTFLEMTSAQHSPWEQRSQMKCTGPRRRGQREATLDLLLHARNMKRAKQREVRNCRRTVSPPRHGTSGCCPRWVGPWCLKHSLYLLGNWLFMFKRLRIHPGSDSYSGSSEEDLSWHIN